MENRAYRREEDRTIHDTVLLLKDDMDELKRVIITGNGGPSLLQRVSRLESWRSWITGIGAALAAVFGYAHK